MGGRLPSGHRTDPIGRTADAAHARTQRGPGRPAGGRPERAAAARQGGQGPAPTLERRGRGAGAGRDDERAPGMTSERDIDRRDVDDPDAGAEPSLVIREAEADTDVAERP